MARKSKKAMDKLQETVEKIEKAQKDQAEELEQAKEAAKKAADDEAALVTDTTEKIDKLCKEADLYCGLVITKADLLKIVELMIDTNEDVKIKFNLYHND